MFNHKPRGGLLTRVKRAFELPSDVIDRSRMSTSTIHGRAGLLGNLINFPYRLDVACTSRRRSGHILMRSRGGVVL